MMEDGRWKVENESWRNEKEGSEAKRFTVILVSRGGDHNNVNYWAATFFNESASTSSMSGGDPIVASEPETLETIVAIAFMLQW